MYQCERRRLTEEWEDQLMPDRNLDQPSLKGFKPNLEWGLFITWTASVTGTEAYAKLTVPRGLVEETQSSGVQVTGNHCAKHLVQHGAISPAGWS